MRHLFIINPMAAKIRGREKIILREIETFFEYNPYYHHDVHITRWARDAAGYIRRYASSVSEVIRVHVFGGSGTLFEAVNGSIGLSNVQLASYPMGLDNCFLRYFGEDKVHLFNSIHNQVFSNIMPIDVMRYGSNYGISHGMVGVEAVSARDGNLMRERMHLPADFCYLWSAVKHLLINDALQKYHIQIDDMELDGEYLTIMAANVPCYGNKMSPAIDAHPNDGNIDIYLVNNMSRRKRLTTVPKYVSGNYRSIPDIVSHYRGKKITIISNDVMCVSVDGENFYDNAVECEIVPRAIEFVYPKEIDISKIPRIYNRPKEGFFGECQ